MASGSLSAAHMANNSLCSLVTIRCFVKIVKLFLGHHYILLLCCLATHAQSAHLLLLLLVLGGLGYLSRWVLQLLLDSTLFVDWGYGSGGSSIILLLFYRI